MRVVSSVKCKLFLNRVVSLRRCRAASAFWVALHRASRAGLARLGQALPPRNLAHMRRRPALRKHLLVLPPAPDA
ncbi:MAG: hypothetical protein EBX37_15575 [Alphaproteobacteria bacterium]|nr:hypothetical protein [Alphaproteobacteria bacterium]